MNKLPHRYAEYSANKFLHAHKFVGGRCEHCNHEEKSSTPICLVCYQTERAAYYLRLLRECVDEPLRETYLTQIRELSQSNKELRAELQAMQARVTILNDEIIKTRSMLIREQHRL